jgi:hypothetical protein
MVGLTMATNISKDLLQALRSDINAALKAVGEKHGVELSAGNASFTPMNATFKLEVRTIAADGVAVTKEQADLKARRALLGLTEEHLTQVFTLGRDSYTLHGYRSKAQSKPFLIKRVSDDKVFIVDEPTVRRALGLPESRF